MDTTTAAAILQSFGLELNSLAVHKGIYMVGTPHGTKGLKKVNFGPPDIDFISSALNHVIDHGFPEVASFEKTGAGQAFVEHQGSYYILTPWIEGRESDYTYLTDLLAAASALARFHLAGKGFRSTFCPQRVRWGKWPEIFSTRLRELEHFTGEGAKGDQLFDKEYTRNAKCYLKQGYNSLELLDRTGYREMSEDSRREGAFCHHDCAYHNVLLTPENKTFLVDFDYSVCDLPLHDLSSLLIRAMKWNKWDFELVPAIVEAYTTINPLPPEAFPVMHAFMTFPQDFFQLGVWRYLEKMPWIEKSFGRKIKRVLKMKKGRNEFLRAFAKTFCRKRRLI